MIDTEIWQLAMPVVGDDGSLGNLVDDDSCTIIGIGDGF